MGQITEERLAKFLKGQENAKRLIQMENSGKLNEYKRNAINNGKLSYNSDSSVDYISTSNQNLNVSEQAQQYSDKKSHLPKAILESFKNNQIDCTSLSCDGSNSILNEVNRITNGKLFEKNEKQTSIQNNTNSSQIVDYSLIKTIVEECVKKYSSALKKSMVNESVSNTNEITTVRLGEKFNFVDNKGNVYEAKLKFIKNINDKKL